MNKQAIFNLPLSAEDYKRFLDIKFDIETADEPFAVYSRNQLQELREFYEYDETLYEDEDEETQKEMRDSCDKLTARVDALVSQMLPDHNYMVGSFSKKDIQAGFEIPTSFVQSFVQEEDAQNHLEYLNFNEALTRFADTNKE